MRVKATIDATTLSEAREKADEQFRGFFGGRDYLVLSESAESYLLAMDGKVLSWRCEFEAEESQ